MIPSNLKYTKTHEWVEVLSSGNVRVGISDYAQDALGDIVFINLPEAGESLGLRDSFAEVESVKAVSEIYSPVEGTIHAVNTVLEDEPERINSTPYDAWIIELENPGAFAELLDASEYEEFIKQEG
ncbi:MAG: glycine cleavage system protein GcvH [Christensenellales bacterium]